MRVAGWTLVVMAVVLHFSVCEWHPGDVRSCVVPFVPFVHAREQFAIHRARGPDAYNTMGAGLWGLVIPLGLVVAGVVLILAIPVQRLYERQESGCTKRDNGCVSGRWFSPRVSP